MANTYLCLSLSSPCDPHGRTHTRNRHLEMNTIIFWTNWAQWKWINVFAFLCHSCPHAVHVAWMPSLFHMQSDNFDARRIAIAFTFLYCFFSVSVSLVSAWFGRSFVTLPFTTNFFFRRIRFCSVSVFFFPLFLLRFLFPSAPKL